MANLTVTVAVTTGTQYVTGSTGSIYTFDGSQPASFTFPWVASGTVRLDQSESSNDNHPLIFSTSNSTTLGTMRAGIISSGVTYYLDGSSSEADYTNTTNFNAATTRYIEIAPTSETDFYFACWVHGIGMGGIVDITQNTWGAFSWGQNQYGSQNHVDVLPTGFLTTGSLGSAAAYAEQGWGRAAWGSEIWGDSYDPVIALTGFSITGSLGTLAYAQAEEGWGRDEWGTGNWRENTTTAGIASGLEMTAAQGPSGWGQSPWDEMVAWGGDLRCETTQLSIATLTGIEATLSLGTATISRLDMIFDITGPSTMSVGLGVPSINNGSDHSQGMPSFLATGSVGSLGHEMTYTLTGLSATMSLNNSGIVIDDTQIVNVSGLQGTGSLGSLTVTDMAIGLSGLSSTGSLGTLVITDMQVGLSGLEISGTLGSGGVSPLHYKDVDITGNTSYTYVEHSA